MAVRERNFVADAARFLKVLVAIGPHQRADVFQGRIGRIDITIDASQQGVSQELGAGDFEGRPGLLPLVPVEDTDGNGDVRTDRVLSVRIVERGISGVPTADSWV